MKVIVLELFSFYFIIEFIFYMTTEFWTINAFFNVVPSVEKVIDDIDRYDIDPKFAAMLIGKYKRMILDVENMKKTCKCVDSDLCQIERSEDLYF